MSGWGEDLPGEEWLPVVGYEGLYSVSNKGRVRSEYHVVIRKNGSPHTNQPELRKPVWSGRHGQKRLTVRVTDKTGRRKTRYLHQLILEAFVGPRPPGSGGLHWDDNPANNVVENLRWGTNSDNQRDAVRNGTHSNTKKTHCVRGHEYTPENTVVWVYPHRTWRQCHICIIEGARLRRAVRKAERAA